MNLISFLLRSGGRRVATVVIAGVLSGLASTGFVALVHAALKRGQPELLIVAFVAVALVRVASNVMAQWQLVRFAQDSLLRMCDDLTRRVVETPFRTLERVGPARVMSTLSDDVAILSAALQAMPNVITNAAVLIGCLAYLAVLHPGAAGGLLLFGIVGAGGYRLLMGRVAGALVQARAERDTMFGHYRTLTEGVKELKMSRARRRNLIARDLAGTFQRLKRLNLAAARQYLIADGWTQIMFFAIMGAMLFALPGVGGMSLEAVTGYAFVSLYAMTPIWTFINAVPIFQRGQTALERIEELGMSLAPAGDDRAEQPPAPSATIELSEVTFRYESTPTSDGFALGPVDLTVHPGELVFLIGGNGSGKSTFVKLLTGLYPPASGEVRVNGRLVTEDERESYREQFSAVFSDFHLFADLAGATGPAADDRARGYLRTLDLDHKVEVSDGVFSTTALSQGQRRRLALLAAYMEDRPVYVFDEWAADQDPAYRQIFYSKLLPELKARGKTVVVITHDDRYFNMGDLVVKLDYGRIVDSWRPAEGAAPAGIVATHPTPS